MKVLHIFVIFVFPWCPSLWSINFFDKCFAMSSWTHLIILFYSGPIRIYIKLNYILIACIYIFGRKKDFVASYSLEFLIEGRQGRSSGRNLEAGSRETMKECCLLACLSGLSSWLVSLLTYKLRTSCTMAAPPTIPSVSLQT